jgi:hypothetical protein
MKLFAVFILTVSLLLTLAFVASAEIIKVSGEVGPNDFQIIGGEIPYVVNPYSIEEKPQTYYANVEFNLLLARLGVELGYADLNPYYYNTKAVRVGWEFGKTLHWKIFAGYREMVLDDKSLPVENSQKISGLITGIGLNVKVTDKLIIYGLAEFPQSSKYNNLVITDGEAIMSYRKVGVIFSPFPLVDCFVNYRATGAGYDTLDISASGYTAGLRLGF